MFVVPSRLLTSLVLAAGVAVSPVTTAAQNLFAPAITVDEQVITAYELQQRARMLEVLNAPGDPNEAARENLIEERLQLAAARRAGIAPTEEEILDGMAEFAGRADLSREEFVQRLSQAGIAEQTFRDFVRAGVSWRQFVRQRFAADANVAEAKVDRALEGGAVSSNIRVLVSEIIIPAPPPQAAEARAIAEQISTYTSEAQFSAAAREYSATATREQGGRLPWQDITDLPPQLRPILLNLEPGEVSAPLPIQNGVALFQLRGIEESGTSAPEIAELEYAAYYIAGGRSREALARARVVASQADRCDDLYGIAKGQPANVLEVRSGPPSSLPTDIALELSKLDPGETSSALTRNNGQTLVLLMLCSRSEEVAEDEDARRNEVRLGLRNRRVQQLAENYLAELRANARIVER
ncbi:peptidylprolyl isomerase [Roseivivax halodurans JCM 10272]|uniref:Parvulin-like PPIase n=1 Tax=Roseivivax halodurans JCM 10272 TaxID=1449350 RepID=X7EEZ3_9RHOB|nr:peptidylprolyl isomerase [Roseivivax halodurans]ETX14664.1 peptidylprolyl isomerase [Roseivivax halodurans JCM 10272]